MRTGGIDPGVWTVAWCTIDDHEVRSCGYEAVNTANHARRFVESLGLDFLVIERPVVYPGGRGRGDPNDLIDLAITVGACAASCPSTRIVTPAFWKGQVPKNIHHPRILARLVDKERALVESVVKRYRKSEQHNILDAVGIALWATGRNS